MHRTQDINDPQEEEMINCKQEFDTTLKRYVLRALRTIDAQHEIFMKTGELTFTNGIIEGKDLLRKIISSEEKESVKVAEKAASRLSQELKMHSKPRS